MSRSGIRLAASIAVTAALILIVAQVGSAQTVKQIFAFSSTYSSPVPGFVTPAQGRDGNLYGTTTGLGNTQTDGTVFRATTSGKESATHTFKGTDGAFPLTGVTLGTDGNLYGTAGGGGTLGNGLLFKISLTGVYTVLYEFTGAADGGFPIAPPIEGWDGNFYGTAGPGSGNSGTVYKLTPSGTFSTILSFSSDNSQGTTVESPLLQAADGNLYGVANTGGTNNCGTVFKVSRSGTLLFDYSFPCGSGGAFPVGQLIQASDGNFYGTTELGGTSNGCGSNGCGTVFKMTQQGSVSILYNFVGGRNDGSEPVAGLVQGTDGNLYGATGADGVSGAGTLYQITTGGVEKLLYSFPQLVGQAPAATLLQHTNGKFYGTAERGGKYGEGSLCSLDMGLGPFITFVLPAGRVGQPAQILGQGLTGTTSVTFNGVAATSFKVVNDTFMTATVPSGATKGPVVVTTPGGPLTSNVSFTILK